MFTEGTQTLLKTFCIIILILGFFGGILVGRTLRTPEVNVDYDSFSFDYEIDSVVELKWSNASTVGMLVSWFISAVLALIIYALYKCLESLDILHQSYRNLNYKIQKTQEKDQENSQSGNFRSKIFKDKEM